MKGDKIIEILREVIKRKTLDLCFLDSRTKHLVWLHMKYYINRDLMPIWYENLKIGGLYVLRLKSSK